MFYYQSMYKTTFLKYAYTPNAESFDHPSKMEALFFLKSRLSMEFYRSVTKTYSPHFDKNPTITLKYAYFFIWSFTLLKGLSSSSSKYSSSLSSPS